MSIFWAWNHSLIAASTGTGSLNKFVPNAKSGSFAIALGIAKSGSKSIAMGTAKSGYKLGPLPDQVPVPAVAEDERLLVKPLEFPGFFSRCGPLRVLLSTQNQNTTHAVMMVLLQSLCRVRPGHLLPRPSMAAKLRLRRFAALTTARLFLFWLHPSAVHPLEQLLLAMSLRLGLEGERRWQGLYYMLLLYSYVWPEGVWGGHSMHLYNGSPPTC